MLLYLAVFVNFTNINNKGFTIILNYIIISILDHWIFKNDQEVNSSDIRTKCYKFFYRVGADVLLYSYSLYSSTQFEVLCCTQYSCTHNRKYSVLVLEYFHKVLVLSEYIQSTFTINRILFSIYFHLSL